MHATPIVASATVQTTVRQPLLMAGAPATTIAIAGSQYSKKTRHRLERMSRDLQVEALESTLVLRYQDYSKIWSAVQIQAKIAVESGANLPLRLREKLPAIHQQNSIKLPTAELTARQGGWR